MKVVVFYPYATGANAFLGGVSKVAVSNIIAVQKNGDVPYLVLPSDNEGLIGYVKTNHPYCIVCPVKFRTLSKFTETKNIFKKSFKICENLWKMFRGMSGLKKLFYEIQPDVIHFHEFTCFNLLGLYKKAKIVVHLHSYSFTTYGFYKKFVIRSLNKHADVVISPTKSIKEALDKDVKNIVIIKTPYLEMGKKDIDLSEFKYLEDFKKEGCKIFSYVGRITQTKRIEHFLKCLARLEKEDLKKVKYVVIGVCNTIGDKDYKKELDIIIKENNLQEAILYVGYVNPIEKVLPYVDYGVMLTNSEAMPMVGIEYLKYNIPTIGYDAPGINDFVIDEINGFLVRNGDIDHLVEVTKRVVNDIDIPDFKRTLPDTYNGYSVDNFAVSLKKIYA